jgi:hypothetical protein
MSCITFLGVPLLHVSHGLVVRTLASGAGGPGSNPGGVPCGMVEEWLWKLWVMDDVIKVCKIVRISLIICSQKCHLNLLKFQKIFVEI